VSGASHFQTNLGRETSGRVLLNSFVGQYVPILYYPSDVTGPLAVGRINLHEAAQLARLTPDRLECVAAGARYAMREFEPDDVDDESLDQFMAAADHPSTAIYRIELKRRQREKGARRLPV
jgi:hypothetical protein